MQETQQVQPYGTEGSRSSGQLARTPSREQARTRPKGARSRVNVHELERLASVLGGGLAVAWGLSRGSLTGKAAALVGGGLVYRGVTGHCQVYEALGVSSVEPREAGRLAPAAGRQNPRKYDVLRKVTVQKPAAEVYRAWKQPEMLARVMSHFAELHLTDEGRTRWAIRDPLGFTHSWETEVVEDEPNRVIRFGTTDAAPLFKTGTLTLGDAPGDRGTEVCLHLRLERPAGALGELLAKLLGPVPSWVVERALKNFKSLMEAGELPSIEKNPAARGSAAR